MKLATDKKTEIMQFAERELASKGIHGFSFRDVAVGCNIKSSSVHYHFPKKNDLIIAVLEQCARKVRQQFEGLDREEAEPHRRLGLYLESVRGLARDCVTSTFCPVMMAATEAGASDPAVVKATRKFFDMAVEWLTGQLQAIRQHESVTPEDQVDAELIYQMLEGGMISVRMTGEPKRIETVLRTIEQQVLG
jgi:TetR/AcrR family transcriptional regulator, transcriptional repressor for nem operon